MEHKDPWFVRLNVMRLEDRTPPGALHAIGIDLGGLAAVIVRPEPAESTHVVKRITAPEDIQIVAPRTDAADTVTAPTAKTIYRTESPTQTVRQTATNPAFHQAASDVIRRRMAGQMASLNSMQLHGVPAPTVGGEVDTAPIQATSANEFLQRYGAGWTVRNDCTTGNPSFIYGQEFAPSLVPGAPADQDPAQWEAAARTVVDENQQFFGFGSESLKLDAVTVLPLSKTGSSDKVAVTFKQYAQDIPVFNGSVSILFDAARKTVLALDTTGVPFADQVPTNFDAHVQQDAIVTAWTAYANTLGVPATQLDSVEPMIVGPSAYFAENHGLSDFEPTLAYQVKLSSPGVLDHEGHPIAGTVFVSADLSVLKVESSVHELDPIKGNIKGNVNTGQEPNYTNNQEQPMLANLWIRQNNSAGAILATSSVNGRFRFEPPVSPINLFFELRGPYFNVNNSAGADASFTVASSEGSNHSILFNPTMAELTTAQVAGAYWVNAFRNFVKGVNPTDTHMDFSVTTNVNIGATCNAYYDGSSINMYKAGGSCPNTAYATVIHHEEGHWANNLYNGSVTGAFHEGAADAWAYYINDTPCLAPEFYGPGQGCLRSGEQTSIKKCTSSACNETCHGGGVHTEGQVLGGALWKVRANLEASLGQAAGGAVASALFMDWFITYNDTAICTNIEDHWLVLDDDDGNLGNGTPHKAEIDAGFVAQGWPGA